MPTPEEGKELIALARNSVKAALSKENLEISTEIKKRFSEKRGVFVTLHKNNMLRGCIGFPEPVYPLYEAIARAAIASAFRDPRFPPLKKEELSEVKFEISVLTLPSEIKVSNPEEYPKKIEIGKDGLIVNSGPFSGLLLPQVATEHNFSEEEFLCCCCQKAGLDDNSWKNGKCKIFKFQAQIFSEE